MKVTNHKKARNSKFFEQLLKAPEYTIDKVDLIYINNDKLTIVRERNGKNFTYVLNGKILSKEKDLVRIKKLVIPPAWENVRISALKNGHLQAVGTDIKNRKQYRYHPLWTKIRNQTKFYKMVAFAKQLPKIRKRIDEDLELEGFPKNKILALILRLMEETHIRIGNEQYARRNKTYGLTTLRDRHVSIEGKSLRFEFVGKKGKQHRITLKNKRLIKLVNRCEELPGWELFQYYDVNKKKHHVESGMVNDYLHEISGTLFSAKDFRTWSATVLFFETVMELGLGQNEKETHKNILKGYDAAAKELGNTRNVCKKYYVHPYLVATYTDGSLQISFDAVTSKYKPQAFFTKSEQAILNLLENYTPEFLKNIEV